MERKELARAAKFTLFSASAGTMLVKTLVPATKPLATYTVKAIVEEELCAYPKGHRQVWFRRTTENGATSIKGSSYLKVPSAVKPFLNDNMLLLSLLANYPNVDSHKRVAPVVDWFFNGLDLYSRAPESQNDFPFSGDIVNGERGTEFMRSFIQNMMRQADVGIYLAEVEKRPMDT